MFGAVDWASNKMVSGNVGGCHAVLDGSCFCVGECCCPPRVKTACNAKAVSEASRAQCAPCVDTCARKVSNATAVSKASNGSSQSCMSAIMSGLPFKFLSKIQGDGGQGEPHGGRSYSRIPFSERPDSYVLALLTTLIIQSWNGPPSGKTRWKVHDDQRSEFTATTSRWVDAERCNPCSIQSCACQCILRGQQREWQRLTRLVSLSSLR